MHAIAVQERVCHPVSIHLRLKLREVFREIIEALRRDCGSEALCILDVLPLMANRFRQIHSRCTRPNCDSRLRIKRPVVVRR